MGSKSPTAQLIPLGPQPLLSVCIPAYNEEENIGRAIDVCAEVLSKAEIPFEFVIANDNSKDDTEAVVRSRMDQGIPIRLVNRRPPGGFGRAVRSCFDHMQGEIVAVVMADLSDDPEDIVRCYRKINEGYDAVFGTRFAKGSLVREYPFVKLIANRVGNKLLQFLFRTEHNDLTNAFKVYRADALRSLMPFYASHFNLTIEVSLGLLLRKFKIASLPINWYGRTHGLAKFKIAELGRRYFATMLKTYAEWIFIHDDLILEHDRKIGSLYDLDSEEVISNTAASSMITKAQSAG